MVENSGPPQKPPGPGDPPIPLFYPSSIYHFFFFFFEFGKKEKEEINIEIWEKGI
jgi:hypothetical protein